MGRPSGQKPPEVKHWFDLDFGDAEVKLEEFEDGIFALWIDDARVLLDTEQMRLLAAHLRAVAVGKEWVAVGKKLEQE